MYPHPSPAVILEAANGGFPAWGSLGVGGILAGIVFWFYVRREKEIVATLSKFSDSFQSTIERNATAMAENSNALREVAEAIRGCPVSREKARVSEDDGRQGMRLPALQAPARER